MYLFERLAYRHYHLMYCLSVYFVEWLLQHMLTLSAFKCLCLSCCSPRISTFNKEAPFFVELFALWRLAHLPAVVCSCLSLHVNTLKLCSFCHCISHFCQICDLLFVMSCTPNHCYSASNLLLCKFYNIHICQMYILLLYCIFE